MTKRMPDVGQGCSVPPRLTTALLKCRSLFTSMRSAPSAARSRPSLTFTRCGTWMALDGGTAGVRAGQWRHSRHTCRPLIDPRRPEPCAPPPTPADTLPLCGGQPSDQGRTEVERVQEGSGGGAGWRAGGSRCLALKGAIEP